MTDSMNKKRVHQPLGDVFELNRRRFLQFFGAGGAGLVLGQQACKPASTDANTLAAAAGSPGLPGFVLPSGMPNWQGVAYPVLLPADPPGTAQSLTRFEVIDGVVVPEGFQWQVVASWGQVFGPPEKPNQQIRFGYNCDFTGLLPVAGEPGQFWLFVNHEEISSRPWLQGYAAVFGKAPPPIKLVPKDVAAPESGLRLDIGGQPFSESDLAPDAATLPPAIMAQVRKLAQEGLGDLGVSVLRVRRLADGRFQVVEHANDHRRINTFESLNAAAGAGKTQVTGPAAALLQAVPGTFSNCSGGVSAWGSFFTCEENIQTHVTETVDSSGQPYEPRTRVFRAYSRVMPGAHQPEPQFIKDLGFALETPLDGRHFGWVCEVEPTTGQLIKHTALGRFRHENVAFLCKAGQALAAYMGDDRRGGHVWKYFSKESVKNPKDQDNRKLLADGTLCAARFAADGSGEWVPLVPETPLVKPQPEHINSGHFFLPHRPEGGWAAVGVAGGKYTKVTVNAWCNAVSSFAGKPFTECTLGDLVKLPEGLGAREAHAFRQAVILLDAYAMANAIGATPSARPEDLEVSPAGDGVFIAFTDASASSEGGVDKRIFSDSLETNSRQYGGIYRIFAETSASGPQSGGKFRWERFLASGEVSEGGGGFVCPDNLVFDPQGHLWFVNDISTSAQNSAVLRDPAARSQPGGKYFTGLFGNSGIFMVPMHGPQKGVPHCFATGPTEAEFTGITFSPDGQTLIVSVQHPGEHHGTRRSANPSEVRGYRFTDREGKLIDQKRTVPLGSNFPSGQLDQPPLPSVICITRKA